MHRGQRWPHEDLLLALLRRADGEGDPANRIALLNDPESRAAFLRHALGHGVLGLVLTALRCSPDRNERLSPVAADALFEPLPALRREATLWDFERTRVVRALRGAGVDPVLLKGAALRLTTYAESVERPVADLDMLVPDHELETALAVLGEAKYRPAYRDLEEDYRSHHFHFVLRNPQGFTVEVHWGLTAPSAPVQLDAEAFRARALRLDAFDAVRVPSPEDMVLHLSCQHLEDGFARLGRSVDIDRVIAGHEEFDWAYLVDRARWGNAGLAAAVGLRLSQILLGTPLPEANPAELFDVPRLTRVGLAAIGPAMVHVQAPTKGNALRRELLTVWTGRGARGWFWALGQRLTAAHYRFWFVTSGAPPPSLVSRVVRVARLLVHQVSVSLAALAALATPRGRRAVRFWTS